jgi:hypothetical protein
LEDAGERRDLRALLQRLRAEDERDIADLQQCLTDLLEEPPTRYEEEETDEAEGV